MDADDVGVIEGGQGLGFALEKRAANSGSFVRSGASNLRATMRFNDFCRALYTTPTPASEALEDLELREVRRQFLRRQRSLCRTPSRPAWVASPQPSGSAGTGGPRRRRAMPHHSADTSEPV